ncbi:MAG: glutamate--tRNA ligase [Alphaproteobacteria bacterium]|nr:glutamate--tRNA ligase [Alphaproteobacteria bacterium]
MQDIKVRLAPSPTGLFHIGSARTALFNWLVAKKYDGKFFVRIEDTDKERSKDEYMQSILDELKWIGLDHDDVSLQSNNIDRHRQVASEMLEKGLVYKCYLSAGEREKMRAENMKTGRALRSPWRNENNGLKIPENVEPSIRFRVHEGKTTLVDAILGETTIDNSTIEDFIILKPNGDPLYNFAVVVDDHDMEISHILRGSDHHTNSFKQALVYKSLNWEIPVLVHMPVILADDGKKMSKRTGGNTIQEIREMGILPTAFINYIVHLGWGYKDLEFMSTKEMIDLFEYTDINVSPAHWDGQKLLSFNAKYITQTDDDELVRLIVPILQDLLKKNSQETLLSLDDKLFLINIMPLLKVRAKTLVELANLILFYFVKGRLDIDEKNMKILYKSVKIGDTEDTVDSQFILKNVAEIIRSCSVLDEETIETKLNEFADKNGIKMRSISKFIYIALTFNEFGPPLYALITWLGKDRILNRITDLITIIDGK